MNKDKEKEKERKRIEQEISDLEKQCRLLGVDVTQAVIGRPAFLNARSVGIELVWNQLCNHYTNNSGCGKRNRTAISAL